MTSHEMRSRGADAKLTKVLSEYGVISIDRLQAIADFNKTWAFRLHMDGRLCGVRELTLMEDDDPGERILMVLSALKRLHEEHCGTSASPISGDGKL